MLSGFLTPTSPFTSRKPVAGQEGFEPPTRGFGVRCSTVGATGLPFFILSLYVLHADDNENNTF